MAADRTGWLMVDRMEILEKEVALLQFRQEGKDDTELVHTRGISMGLDQGDLRTCKSVWGTLREFTDGMVSLRSPEYRYVVAALDHLKDKLVEVLPYGPDGEVSQ